MQAPALNKGGKDPLPSIRRSMKKMAQKVQKQQMVRVPNLWKKKTLKRKGKGQRKK